MAMRSRICFMLKAMCINASLFLQFTININQNNKIMNKLSKPIFNDKEYSALLRIIKCLSGANNINIENLYDNCDYYRSMNWDKELKRDIQIIADSLQASEYVNENHSRLMFNN